MLRLHTIVAAISTLLASTGEAAQAPFKFERRDGRIVLKEYGKPVFSFQVDTKSLEGKYPRANYLHPVYDPDGEALTEDFPKDHLHHRGIFWAWHQVRLDGEPVSDPWICKDITWQIPTIGMSTAKTFGYSSSANLRITRNWAVPIKPGKEDPIIRESVSIDARPIKDGIRRLDFTLSFRALKKGITVGGSDNVKGYGGFSPRIRLSDDVKFLGQIGPVTPRNTAVEGGAWMNITRTLAGKKRSVTILVHPSHPDFPLKWILRAKRSMQNPQWPGRKPVAISTKKDTVLRYRLILHNNQLLPADIEREWTVYSQE